MRTGRVLDVFGAETEDRTRDLALTMGVLYQLSYLGVVCEDSRYPTTYLRLTQSARIMQALRATSFI